MSAVLAASTLDDIPQWCWYSEACDDVCSTLGFEVLISISFRSDGTMSATESEGSYDAILGSFISSVKADLDSPVTSNFGNRIAEYRSEVCLPLLLCFFKMFYIFTFIHNCLHLHGVDLVSHCSVGVAAAGQGSHPGSF